ncbi:MAG: 50S ribosomal protein L21, partial [Candidatus Sericytochromatia bacterium]|nr:50S ribosomal protein L21 [Candidatus Sericytochromatia bacterium]
MYAIIRSGGKQHKIEVGRFVDLELLPQAEGEKVSFDQVLMIVDGEAVTLGSPIVAATVSGTVVKHGRGEKIIVYKMRPKKHYRKKQGHRQGFTRVMIDAIQ